MIENIRHVKGFPKELD